MATNPQFLEVYPEELTMIQNLIRRFGAMLFVVGMFAVGLFLMFYGFSLHPTLFGFWLVILGTFFLSVSLGGALGGGTQELQKEINRLLDKL